jgi:hypothetical protein
MLNIVFRIHKILKIFQWMACPRPCRLELLEGWAEQVSDQVVVCTETYNACKYLIEDSV